MDYIDGMVYLSVGYIVGLTIKMIIDACFKPDPDDMWDGTNCDCILCCPALYCKECHKVVDGEDDTDTEGEKSDSESELQNIMDQVNRFKREQPDIQSQFSKVFSNVEQLSNSDDLVGEMIKMMSPAINQKLMQQNPVNDLIKIFNARMTELHKVD